MSGIREAGNTNVRIVETLMSAAGPIAILCNEDIRNNEGITEVTRKQWKSTVKTDIMMILDVILYTTLNHHMIP